MFPCGLETVWKLQYFNLFAKTLSNNTWNLSKISSYDLLSVSTSALVLEFSSRAVSPAVLTCTLSRPNSYSQQWSFRLQKGWGTKCQSHERGLVCDDIFMDPGTLWQQVALLGLCRCVFCILQLYGNLTKVAVSLAVRWLSLLRWYVVSVCTPQFFRKHRFPLTEVLGLRRKRIKMPKNAWALV